jgi:hypothetical protein
MEPLRKHMQWFIRALQPMLGAEKRFYKLMMRTLREKVERTEIWLQYAKKALRTFN